MNEHTALQIIYPFMQLLVEKKYAELTKNKSFGRLTAEDIGKVINEYGGQLTLPKQSDVKEVFVYPAGKEEYVVETYLWIDQKQSDLTLILRLKKIGKKEFQISIDDLRVL